MTIDEIKSRTKLRSGLTGLRPDGRPRTLGPVSDLERHIPPEWWTTLFNAVYLKTDGDVVEDHELTRREVDLVVALTGIEPEDRVLDLCCGQGRHALELARRGFKQVAGVDRSRFLIRLGRRRAKKAGLSVQFREGDARKVHLPENSFDCVIMMGNSFGYFESADDDARVLESVKHVLRSGGLLLLDLADGEFLREHFEARSWEWIDDNYFVCRERSLSKDGARLISREVVVSAQEGVITDQFYAERLYSRTAIAELLDKTGYRNVRFHGEYATNSERAQDLGMMARRLLITASVPQKAVVVRKRAPIIFPDVTVLLGDPHLPDSVKLGGQFNPEDMDTVQRLKTALSELGDFRFTYLDQHGTMLQALRQNPPAFALNFCDEGFNNDAFLELHVPAFLEVLGVPYSGAGPSCLGLCYDKGLVRAIAQSLDVPVPAETYVDADDIAGTIPSIFPAFIKPATGDSSIGITQHAVVKTPDEAVEYLTFVRESLPGRSVLVQEFLPGEEYSVGIIGNPGRGWTVLPVLEVDYSKLPPGLPPILSYESKWDPQSPYWTSIRYHRAHLSDELHRLLMDYSLRLFERLGCRDYARFDYRMSADGDLKLLEVNPNPGWCWDGKFFMMAEFDGHSYTDFLRLILDAAQARYA
ncbi:methyltransferase domain-containing protein, partial [bacterium]|nr:methyltransferase domain-containing protein [bacterium]